MYAGKACGGTVDGEVGVALAAGTPKLCRVSGPAPGLGVAGHISTGAVLTASLFLVAML